MGMRRGHKVRREIPCSLDMLERIHTDFLKDDLSNASRVELYTSDVLGFFFALRIGELEKMRMSDIRLGRDGNQSDTDTIAIRNSKPTSSTRAIARPLPMYREWCAQ